MVWILLYLSLLISFTTYSSFKYHVTTTTSSIPIYSIFLICVSIMIYPLIPINVLGVSKVNGLNLVPIPVTNNIALIFKLL